MHWCILKKKKSNTHLNYHQPGKQVVLLAKVRLSQISWRHGSCHLSMVVLMEGTKQSYVTEKHIMKKNQSRNIRKFYFTMEKRIILKVLSSNLTGNNSITLRKARKTFLIVLRTSFRSIKSSKCVQKNLPNVATKWQRQ